MIIVLDGTPLSVAKGGIARYAAQLSLALAGGFPDDHYILASDTAYETPAGAPPNLTRAPAPASILERRWWSVGLPRALQRCGAQVFHGTNFEVPLRRVCPSVLSLHDLSPWMDPAWHNGAGRVRRRVPWLLRLRIPTLIVTHTDAVRRQAISHFGLDPGTVCMVHLAAASRFRPVVAAARPRPYFFYAGTLEPRKNIPVVIEAWRELRKTLAVDLLLAGRRREDGPVVPDEPGLEWLGAVEDEALPPLYSGAVGVLYPSLYEGFGLPPLEAMSCGAPVLASSDAAITEVTGGAAELLDAREPRQWTEAMRALMENGDMREKMKARSLARAAAFSWQSTAAGMHAVYEEAVRRLHA
jgi:glycosyltransferase involved in cell wall biosynthesis